MTLMTGAEGPSVPAAAAAGPRSPDGPPESSQGDRGAQFRRLVCPDGVAENLEWPWGQKDS